MSKTTSQFDKTSHRCTGKSSVTPGGKLPENTTSAPAGVILRIVVKAASAIGMSQMGPGITKRYCLFVSVSETDRLWRVSPAICCTARFGRSFRSISCKAIPALPPRATNGVVVPPSSATTRETLIPPPPGSRRGSAQRSFGPASTASTWVARSRAGFNVIVMIGRTGHLSSQNHSGSCYLICANRGE